jgi:geranyl-CoA carboxylase alpha subunit
VRTTQAFLASGLEHPVFAAGEATTAFIGAHGETLLEAAPPMAAPLAALMVYAARSQRLGHDPAHAVLALPWAVPMRLAIDGTSVTAKLQSLEGGNYRVAWGEAVEELTLMACGADSATLRSASGRHAIAFATDGQRLLVSLRGRQTIIDDQSLTASASGSAANNGTVRAPMAGRVIALQVREGQTVAKGDALLVLEAMKMEHPSVAPMDAVVSKVCIEQGAQVSTGALLIELTATATSAPLSPTR